MWGLQEATLKELRPGRHPLSSVDFSVGQTQGLMPQHKIEGSILKIEWCLDTKAILFVIIYFATSNLKYGATKCKE